MRIVHCFRSPVGGIFRHVRDLIAVQRQAGHKTGIVCDSTTGGEFEDRIFSELEPMLPLGLKRIAMQRHIGPGDMGAAWRAYRAIKELKPDVVHGHGAKGGFYARTFGSVLRVSGPRVARLYSPHGGSLHYDEETPSGKAIFLMEGLTERKADHILFVSKYEREAYFRKVGKLESGYSVVYNGLWPEEFSPVHHVHDAADFLYVGMMRDLKGPDLFIDALNLASAMVARPLNAVMVGDGESLEKYRAQVHRNQMNDRVHFLPAMPAREAFRFGKVIVVPSRAESMPYIVLEALAAGMPMIATSVGGIPEIFDKQQSVLRRAEVSDIAQGMEQAIRNPDGLRARMPDICTLQSRFSVQTMAKEIEAAYRLALD